MKKTLKKILGSFGKAIDGSVSVNFSRSASANCDANCAALKLEICYAENIEWQRRSVRENLEARESMDPAELIGRASLELSKLILSGNAPPWVRISTNGSVPMASELRKNKRFGAMLKAFMQQCKRNSIPVHFPVESGSKASAYRELLDSLCVVRETIQNPRAWTKRNGAVAMIAGAHITIQNGFKDVFRARIAYARKLAQKRFEKTGRRVVVCPAIVASFKQRLGAPKNPKAKCGQCTACADANVDILYPKHN